MQAEAQVDIRYYGKHLREKIIAEIRTIALNPTNPKARIEVIWNEGFPSFMDSLNQTFYQIVDDTSIELGLGKNNTSQAWWFIRCFISNLGWCSLLMQ